MKLEEIKKLIHEMNEEEKGEILEELCKDKLKENFKERFYSCNWNGFREDIDKEIIDSCVKNWINKFWKEDSWIFERVVNEILDEEEVSREAEIMAIVSSDIEEEIVVSNDVEEEGLEAYRIFEEENGRIYGNLERYVNCKKQCNKQERKEFTHRTDLKYGMLYCPEVDMIVDELEKIKINIKINELTIIRDESGSRLKSLREMTPEERDEYWSLQDQYDNFYSENVKFVDNQKLGIYLLELHRAKK